MLCYIVSSLSSWRRWSSLSWVLGGWFRFACSFAMCCVHLSPSLPLERRRREVRRLCVQASARAGECLVVIGDLTIRSSTEPTWRAGGSPVVERDRLDDILCAYMPEFTEVLPEGPTHRVRRDGRVVSASVIDRAFTSMPEWDLMDASVTLERTERCFRRVCLLAMCRCFSISVRPAPSDPPIVCRVGLFRGRTSGIGRLNSWTLQANLRVAPWQRLHRPSKQCGW